MKCRKAMPFFNKITLTGIKILSQIFVKNRGKLSEEDAKPIFVQIVHALRACHKKNVIHRDVKLDNILFSARDNKIKLGDFTVSTSLEEEGQKMHNHEGTVAFTAPESHVPPEEGFLPMPTDIWSLGVSLYTYIAQTLPFYAQSELEMQMNAKNNALEMPDYFPDELKDLMSALLHKEPSSRPSAEEALHFAFFTIN